MKMELIRRGLGTDLGRPESAYEGLTFEPRVDILENEAEYILTADMPGVDPKDIDVRLDQGTLMIHGKVAARQPEGTAYLIREYGVGDYRRTFDVGEGIDPERISAEYSDGVLVLHLPKVEAARPRKISVTAK
jgi:HSP20 family protein